MQKVHRRTNPRPVCRDCPRRGGYGQADRRAGGRGAGDGAAGEGEFVVETDEEVSRDQA